MSYNGVGLTTPRGSGTNGYVQKNLSFVRPRNEEKRNSRPDDLAALDRTLVRAPNQEILLHERKRTVEVQCLKLADELEEQGYPVEEIDERVQKLREQLLAKMSEALPDKHAKDTHSVAALNQAKNEKIHSALGIRADHVTGEAFDPVAVSKRREQRKEEKEREWKARQAAKQRLDRERSRHSRKSRDSSSSSSSSSSGSESGSSSSSSSSESESSGSDSEDDRRRSSSDKKKSSSESRSRRSPSPRRDRDRDRSDRDRSERERSDRHSRRSRSRSPSKSRSRSRSPVNRDA
eukprot:m.211292 g.211292  ORF g.211292 m.211292 type:complete len:292 (+) comp18111_c0_seq1:114-989(+)